MKVFRFSKGKDDFKIVVAETLTKAEEILLKNGNYNYNTVRIVYDNILI